jgi:uncharacterized protein (DUF58 family)
MKKPALQGFVALYRYFWIYKTTRPGRLFVAAIVISGSIASASLEIPVYQLVCGLCGLAATAYVSALLMRPRVRVTGTFPAKAVTGQPITGHFALTNRSQRAAYDLSVSFFGLHPSVTDVQPDRLVHQIAPDEQALIPVTLHPKKRGLYTLPELTGYSTFPFNLFRTAVKPHGDPAVGKRNSLLVLPDFHPVADIDVPVSERYQPGGIALSSHVGESPEYISSREYRPGDSTRRLDYRSWARLGQPVVREFQEEYYCRLALVLDTYVPGKGKPGPAGFPNLEAAVSLSASIADVLARGEYIIDIFAAGPELYVFRAGRHTAHFESVLDILACIDVRKTNPFEVVTPALTDELATISTVIAVFLDWDESRETLVRTAIEAGCCVKVFIVREGDTSQPYTGLDGVYAISHYTPIDIRNGGIETL